MFGKKEINPAYIRCAPVSKVMSVNRQNLTITVNDAQYYGDELLDDVLINDMFRDLAKVVGGKTSKYNPLPTSIVISHSSGNVAESDTKAKPLNTDIIRSFSPRWTIDEVCVDKATNTVSNLKYR